LGICFCFYLQRELDWGIVSDCFDVFAAECDEFYANSLFVVGEFGGNDYNAPLFAGKGLEEAYKFMPDVIQAISDGIEVEIQ
jgi:hypothetical protein